MTRVLLWFAAALAVLLLIVRVIYGGGNSYPGVTGTPLLSNEAIEVAVSYPEPIGNVAVAANGDIFFTVHPESRPQGNKLLRYRDGVALPFPDGRAQQVIFATVLGVTIDRQNRLWTIDPGNHGAGGARLRAFDTENGALLHEHDFDSATAPLGSFLQDLVVSDDGNTIVIADVSFLRKRPALVVYDVATQSARRVLEGDPSVTSQGWRIENSYRTMQFFGGLISLMPGVDGIVLDPAGEWVYFAAMSHDGLFRVPLAKLADPTLDAMSLAASIERYSSKPLSDGLSVDMDGNIYITDVEHHAVMRVGSDRRLRTLVESRDIRWPDALSFGPDGWLYIADSALPAYLLQSGDAVEAAQPYRIFRVRPGNDGLPGR